MSAQANFSEPDDLAILALNAATQLDKLQRKASGYDFGQVEAFADSIGKMANQNGEFFDPTSYGSLGSEMLGAAVISTSVRKPDDIKGLNTELKSLLADLKTDKNRVSNSDQNLIRLMQFCLSVFDVINKRRPVNTLHEVGMFDYENNFVG
jgi:hypothetical protein